MMQAVGSARLVYLAWMVGGVLSFFGALTYAELGAMKPQAGGEYVYVRDAYGPLAGFLYAWTWFLIAKPASIATITTGLVRILETFPGLRFFLAFSRRLHSLASISRSPMDNWWRSARPLLISWLNYIGVRRAGEFQFLFTLLKVAIILGIVGVGFSYSGGTWANFATEFAGAKGGVAGFFAALVAALWAYDGWNDLNMVAGEIRNPQRNIPLSLIWGVATVGAALHSGQCGGAVCAAGRRSGGFGASGVGCGGAGAGARGREPGFGGHGGFYARDFEWHHHERSARAVCHGARWVFFQGNR